MPTKKRCCICHEPFTADLRVGARQQTCLSDQCRTEHRRRTQEAWRNRNPSYFADYYLQGKERVREEQEAAPSAAIAEPRGQSPPAQTPLAPIPIKRSERWRPAPLDRIPWEFIAQVFTPAQADALNQLARTLVGQASESSEAAARSSP